MKREKQMTTSDVEGVQGPRGDFGGVQGVQGVEGLPPAASGTAHSAESTWSDGAETQQPVTDAGGVMRRVLIRGLDETSDLEGGEE